MGYRVQKTGEYLPTEFALRDRHIGIIAPNAPITADVLKNIGVDPVLEGPQATGGTVYQYSEFAGLEKIGTTWYTKYVLGPTFRTFKGEDGKLVTAAAQEAAYKARKDADQAANMRDDRNRRLEKCDWTQLADSPVDKAAWATYRQALRDVTDQDGFPWNVEWPTQPE